LARGALRAALALVLLAGACTRDGNGGGGAPESVLRVGITAPGTLDPAQARSFEELLVADQLFGTLTSYDAEEGGAVPGLAERWEADADQRVWDFFLDPDARFSDDRPVTAADVKWSLERVARRGSGSAGAELLEFVSGFPAFGREGTVDQLAGLEAVADDHLRVTLDQPLSVLPVVMASPVLGVLAKVDGDPDLTSPLSSGPFELTERSPDGLRLLSIGGEGVREIRFRIFENLGESYQAFVDGELDWSRVPPERVEDAAVRFGDDGFVPYAGELLFAFNMNNPKFSDSRVRQGILQAIDRAALVRAVYGTTVAPLDGITVDGVPGNQADACGTTCQFSQRRARDLLAEARPGQPPLEVFLDYDEDPTQEAVARAIQSNLEAVGVRANLRPKPLGEYQNFVLSGQQEIFRLGWIAAYPSADAFLHPLFTTGSPSNLTGYSVPAVDAQLRDARAEPDPERRAELYRAAERAVMSTVPVIPLAQLKVHTVVTDRVEGLKTNVMGTFDATKVRLG
jgi:oligopeptide transport system substrate-binding protein